MQSQADKFLQHLDEKGKKQAYVNALEWRLPHINDALQIQPTSPKVINNLVRSIWSGYVSRDKAVYRFLNDYANFCPKFAEAFNQHVRETFEGEARKAMNELKNAIVYIPKDTKINPCFLGLLTKDEFIEAFQALQELMYSIYDDGDHGSPFDWGWPDWKALHGKESTVTAL